MSDEYKWASATWTWSVPKEEERPKFTHEIWKFFDHENQCVYRYYWGPIELSPISKVLNLSTEEPKNDTTK